MNCATNFNTPLQSIFWSKDSSFFKQALLVLAGAFVLAIASQLSIPLLPVPLTFQSATVILIGMAFGARKGGYVIATYLVAGALGLPVFANLAAGPGVFAGPTAGYLAGFLPAAMLSGYFAEKGWGKSILCSFAAACLGVSIIFLSGVTVLAQFIGWQDAFALGVMPFIISEPIKLLAVACVIPRLWKNK